MLTITSSLNGLLSSPLASIAGVLAAVVVVLLVMKFRRAGRTARAACSCRSWCCC